MLNDQAGVRRRLVLVAGPDFGTGSSREHAVWALMDYGFRSSCRRGSPTSSAATAARAGCSPPSSTSRWSRRCGKDIVEADPTTGSRSTSAPTITRGGMATWRRSRVDDYIRWRLMEGLDDIGLTSRRGDITAFEATARRSRRPTDRPGAVPGARYRTT